MIFCQIDGLNVVNMRIGPSTGGVWMIDFDSEPSRAGLKSEVDYIWNCAVKIFKSKKL